MEITQFTYFQQVGGLDCKPVLGRLTTGSNASRCTCRARTASSTHVGGRRHYRDVYHQNEVEQSKYNFEASDPTWLLSQFNDYERKRSA